MAKLQAGAGMNLVFNIFQYGEDIAFLSERFPQQRLDTLCQAKVGIGIEQYEGQ